jgi:chromosome segregation ATPase
MFGKKVSEAEYNELEQKYLTFECAYNNEHAKCSDLEQQVKELTDQINRLKEAGNVLSEDLVKRAENAENQVKELNVLLEVEKSKNSSSEGNKQLQANYEKMYEIAAQELETEKSKNAELTAKLQLFSGGNRMDKTEWEYKVIEQNSSDDVAKNEKELQQLGSQNWEVTGVMPQNSSNNNQIILKRPKQTIPEYGYTR